MIVPNITRHGNSICTSHAGGAYAPGPLSPRTAFAKSHGNPLKIATPINPATIPVRFPTSLPRVFVVSPSKKIPSSDPYVYPKIPSTIGMIRACGD